jgi:hypothetical protein
LFKRIDPSKASRPIAPAGDGGPPERIGRATPASIGYRSSPTASLLKTSQRSLGWTDY